MANSGSDEAMKPLLRQKIKAMKQWSVQRWQRNWSNEAFNASSLLLPSFGWEEERELGWYDERGRRSALAGRKERGLRGWRSSWTGRGRGTWVAPKEGLAATVSWEEVREPTQTCFVPMLSQQGARRGRLASKELKTLRNNAWMIIITSYHNTMPFALPSNKMYSNPHSAGRASSHRGGGGS